MNELLARVVESCMEHNRIREAGDNYRAALVCRGGNHRSVATSLGLQTYFERLYKVKVDVEHRSQETGCWKKFCGQRCYNCKYWPERKDEEMQVIAQVIA